MRFMIANLLLALLPPTRSFAAKRFVLRLLGISVGRGTNVCGSVKFFGGGRVVIGDECWIGIGSRFITSRDGDVVIGDRCDIAPETCFMNGSHAMGGPERRAGPGYSKHIEVGDGVWIGVRSTIMGGAKIGDGCAVGAGSLVLNRTWQPNSLLFGVPAKFVREL